MYKCIYCGYESLREKAEFCSKCGPDSPANSWQPDEIDNISNVEKYMSILGEFYFETHSAEEIEKLSLRRREKLKISYGTHTSILADFQKQKKSIEHLSKFRFEFNENVTDAYAGHDTFLEFRISNLSEDDSFKVSLLWDDPETVDRIELQTESKKFVAPNSSIIIGSTTVFSRIGIKEISDLQITIKDEFGGKANFYAEAFRFKVRNHEQRLTQNISTHNQISVEGRGVIDASGMGVSQNTLSVKDINEPRWLELSCIYIPQINKKNKSTQDVKANIKTEEILVTELIQPTASELDMNDPLQVIKAAEQGDVVAQSKLGSLYLNGHGLNQSDELAFKWYQKAAAQGDSDGQFNLGFMYDEGRGVTQNYDLAFEWYKKSAENGDLAGQVNLGLMYENGSGVKKNNELAFEWFLKAAENGHVKGIFSLGRFYLFGRHVQQSDKTAFEYFLKAAENGHLGAHNNLAWMYLQGRGIEQNDKLAFEWYQKAAVQGDSDGQCNLGWMFFEGRGVAQNYELGVQWYRKASEQGNDKAVDALLNYLNLAETVQKDVSSITPLPKIDETSFNESDENPHVQSLNSEAFATIIKYNENINKNEIATRNEKSQNFTDTENLLLDFIKIYSFVVKQCNDEFKSSIFPFEEVTHDLNSRINFGNDMLAICIDSERAILNDNRHLLNWVGSATALSGHGIYHLIINQDGICELDKDTWFLSWSKFFDEIRASIIIRHEGPDIWIGTEQKYLIQGSYCDFSKNIIQWDYFQNNILDKMQLAFEKFKNSISSTTLIKSHHKAETSMVNVKVGRNEPCPCGSNKKYKECHGILL